MKNNRYLLVAVFFGCLIGQAQGETLLYDNGAPQLGDSSGGNPMTQQLELERFTLASASTINSIAFWDFEQAGSYSGSFVYRIFADNAGTPGAILFSGTVAGGKVRRSSQGMTDPSGDTLFRNDLMISPLALAAGSYFLGLHNGPLTTISTRRFFLAFSVAGQLHAMEKGEALAVDAPMRIARAIQAKLAKVGSRPHWYARESLPEIMTILDHEIRRALAREDAD